MVINQIRLFKVPIFKIQNKIKINNLWKCLNFKQNLIKNFSSQFNMKMGNTLI